MRAQDLKSISVLGKALWPEADVGQEKALETLAAISLTIDNEDAAFERATRALLDRAGREFLNAKQEGLARSFFRLPLKSRFLLALIHADRWSYSRLSRVLGESEDAISRELWAARLALFDGEKMDPQSAIKAHIKHPVGIKSRGIHCPEYNTQNPWTQKFLDDELQPRARQFVQNHLMACDSCRQTLNQCRDFYFEIDRLVPLFIPATNDKDGGAEPDWEALAQKWNADSDHVQYRKSASFGDSLVLFLKRTDVKLVFIFSVGYLAYTISLSIAQKFF